MLEAAHRKDSPHAHSALLDLAAAVAYRARSARLRDSRRLRPARRADGREQTTPVQSGPTITSDKADYAPNDAVTLTGGGWQPGENVHIVVNDDGLQEPVWQHDATVVADADGNIVDQFDLPQWVVANYTVTATGEFSGTAYTTFTDSHTENGCGTAATLTVTTNLDVVGGGAASTCSLREAIIASNAHPTITTINLSALTYTLTIDAGEEDNAAANDLDVRDSVTINGDAAGGTIIEAGTTTSNGIDNVFDVYVAGTTLVMNDLTVRHGLNNTAGGGIFLGPTGSPGLTLNDVTVTANTLTGGVGGAGLYVDGANAVVMLD